MYVAVVSSLEIVRSKLFVLKFQRFILLTIFFLKQTFKSFLSCNTISYFLLPVTSVSVNLNLWKLWRVVCTLSSLQWDSQWSSKSNYLNGNCVVGHISYHLLHHMYITISNSTHLNLHAHSWHLEPSYNKSSESKT